MLSKILDNLKCHPANVHLWLGSFVLGSSGAVGTSRGCVGDGVTITRDSAGQYNLSLDDPTTTLVAGFVQFHGPDDSLDDGLAKLGAIDPDSATTTAKILTATAAAPTTEADLAQNGEIHLALFVVYTDNT